MGNEKLLNAIFEKENYEGNSINRDEVEKHLVYLETRFLEETKTLAEKDHNPYKHCLEVENFILKTREELGLSGNDVIVCAYAARMHDIGKVHDDRIKAVMNLEFKKP